MARAKRHGVVSLSGAHPTSSNRISPARIANGPRVFSGTVVTTSA